MTNFPAHCIRPSARQSSSAPGEKNTKTAPRPTVPTVSPVTGSARPSASTTADSLLPTSSGLLASISRSYGISAPRHVTRKDRCARPDRAARRSSVPTPARRASTSSGRIPTSAPARRSRNAVAKRLGSGWVLRPGSGSIASEGLSSRPAVSIAIRPPRSSPRDPLRAQPIVTRSSSAFFARRRATRMRITPS